MTAKYAKLTTAPCDLINDDEDFSELVKSSPFKALEADKKHESQVFENRAPLPRTGDDKSSGYKFDSSVAYLDGPLSPDGSAVYTE